MIAKNIKGKSFSGCVKYVMNSTSELLEVEGILAYDADSIIQSFKMQGSGRSEIKQPVGHIPISFSPEDKSRMTNEFMVKLAKEYMQEMGIKNTQYVIVRHNNTAHDHIHVVYNRIDNNLKLISVNNDFKRNIATCKKLKDRHNLTYGEDKSRVNKDNLRGFEKSKHETYDAIRAVITRSRNITELSNNLKPYGVNLLLKYCRGTEKVEGISFEKDGHKFKGSQIDRKFSYNGLQGLFDTLAHMEASKRENSPKKRIPASIGGVALTKQQQAIFMDGKSILLDGLRTKTGEIMSAYAMFSEKDQKVIVIGMTHAKQVR